MGEKTYQISVNDLTDVGTFALAYAQAVVYGPASAQAKRFRDAEAALPRTASDKRRALASGLAELAELGVIECYRDGAGDLVPAMLHEEKLKVPEARLVTRDFS